MKTLAILSLLFSSLFQQKVDKDYISFENTSTLDVMSTNVIYVTKEPFSAKEMVGSSDFSPERLDFTVSDNMFSLVEQQIKSTPKQQYKENHSSFDIRGLYVKVHKNNRLFSYFISQSNARVLLDFLMKKMGKNKRNRKLVADIYNLRWPNPRDRIKADYVSLQYSGKSLHELDVIYISTAFIPFSRMTNLFDISPAHLDIIGKQEFTYISQIINSTSKKHQPGDSEGIIVKVKKTNHAVNSYFINRANSNSMFETIMSHLKKRGRCKKLITDIFNLEWLNTELHGIKNDFISFEHTGEYEWLSTHTVYISKQPIATSQLLANFGYSSGVNYVLPSQAFSTIERIIKLAPKRKFIALPPPIPYYDSIPKSGDKLLITTLKPVDSAFMKRLQQRKDSDGVVIRIHKNNVLKSYFVHTPALMFQNVLSYLNKHNENDGLAIDITDLNWENTPKDSVKRDFICFEYRGDADKNMIVIWISKTPLFDSDEDEIIGYDDPGQNFTISNDEYHFLRETIESTEHKTFADKDYNGFKVHIRENGVYKYYFIRRRNVGTLFLKATDYLKHRKRNNDLLEELRRLRLGNVFPDP